MLPRLRHIAFAVLAASILFASGCGGSDSTTASLSKAQFVKQADAICEAADEAQAEALQRFGEETPQLSNKQINSKATQETIIKAVGLPPIRAEIKELSELGVPEGDEDQIEAIISGLEQALKQAEANPVALTDEKGGPFTEVGKLAAKYGLKACADPI